MIPIRLAVIGAGHLGRIHARLLKQVDGAQLVGVADPIEAARQAAAAECGVNAIADYRQLIGQIDAAIVATPTVLHHAVGCELLRAGIHLLIEKPLASTLAEADELLAAARAGGAILQVGHIERFNPALAAVQDQVPQPKYIQASRMSGYTFRSTDIGVVLDLMIHDIDLVLSLTRSPLRHVDAIGVSVIGDHEDIAQARLTFANGCIANLTASRVSYRAERVMQIWSSSGFAAVDFSTRDATVVRPSAVISNREIQIESLTAERKQHLKDHLFDELLPASHFQAEANNALLDELKDFVRSVQTGSQPRVTGEDGRAALQVAEQVLEQIEAHAWNGESEGPIGPRLLTSRPILRGPHWSRQPASTDSIRRKEAS